MKKSIMTSMHLGNSWQPRIVMSVVLATFFLLPHQTVFADAFPMTLTPAVIDGEAKAREILRYKVTITNNSKQLLTLYPWARDMDQLGQDPKTQGLDPTQSLLSWLEFSRSEIVLPAGESVDLPLLVQVNLRARPGIYHSQFHVSDGPNRAEAEANFDRTVSLMINIRILDDANERLQLGVFAAEKNLFMGDNATFGFRLENTGNRGVAPTGKIRIFDRKGEEVDVVDINNTGDRIEPESKKQLASVWQSGEYFGKYKAMLDVSYGKTGTIQDTVFFWVLPWKKLLSFFVTLGIICTLLALLIHSYSASGGKKLALVRERFSDDDHSLNIADRNGVASPETESLSMFSRMTAKWKQKYSAMRDSRTKEEYVDALIEVSTPVPQRTRQSIGMSPTTSDRVHLAPRAKKQHVDPAHIVHLK